MTRKPISFENLRANVHPIWSKQGMLLTSGDFAAGHFNTMTVGWGSLGVMWRRPFAQVVVRPSRYTYEFIEQYESFTLCAFPEAYRQALQLLGTRSGRDGDKITESGLTPIASVQIPAPGFAEADLIVECRKMYWQDMDPSHFLDPTIENHYAKKDYHRITFGEVVAINGTGAYVGHA